MRVESNSLAVTTGFKGSSFANSRSLRHYSRSYGDRRDKKERPSAEYRQQQADRDMVYSFCFKPTGFVLPKVALKRPPKSSDILASTEACACGFITQAAGYEQNAHHFWPSGYHRRLQGSEKEEVVAKLCQRFLSEVSGRHVG
eukprot:TRINITY_DN28348_c0_g1_i2.p1 TRINITY_DN28348_c0_g1~~TRINITY_DN28348_c0_g1_i2.p1  ORF type:complete len:143 (-),score=25.65 TRINITY_DN28348_c0_g1_i2:44-472(-)